jgi:hypothetical protein
LLPSGHLKNSTLNFQPDNSRVAAPASIRNLHSHQPRIPTYYLQATAVAAADMATTIYIKNIGAQTADQEIKDFFSFW